MPKLQSANGRLKLMSRSGCFLYYLFLLSKPCHRTILLQETINNSSQLPRCTCCAHLQPVPCKRDSLGVLSAILLLPRRGPCLWADPTPVLM